MTTLNLYQRMNAVRETVDYIKKDKAVEGYKAVTHDAVTALVRPALIKHGIVMSVSLTDGRLVESGAKTTKGTPIVRYEAVFEVAFINMDSPIERERYVIPAHALDHGDKAPGKALSYAVKSAILKAFNIETGESDESRYGSDDDGLDTDDVVKIEDGMRACSTKAELRKALEDAHAAARNANDPGASKRFTKIASALAEKLPDVKMPAAKADAPAERPTSTGPATQDVPASKGLVASIRNLAKAKGYDLSSHEPIEGLGKSAAAALLTEIGR